MELNSIVIPRQSSVLGCSSKRLQESIALWTTVVHMEDVACLPNTTPLSITTIDYDLEVLTHPLTESEIQELREEASTSSSNQPYHSTSWLEAVHVANRLSERQGLNACYDIHGENVTWPMGLQCTGWRLPTELEWELVMRAGNTNAVWSGEHNDAWDNPNTKNLPVCSTTGNELGICDIVDNTWEWTWDWFGAYTTLPKLNDTGPTSGTKRVIRNGRHRGGLSIQSTPQKPTSIRLVRSIQGK
jgi:formylglycine-generating enzyme required for sulfatase activity